MIYGNKKVAERNTGGIYTTLLSKMEPVLHITGIEYSLFELTTTGLDKSIKVSEKGPLFKIEKPNLDLLFSNPIEYSLVN